MSASSALPSENTTRLRLQPRDIDAGLQPDGALDASGAEAPTLR